VINKVVADTPLSGLKDRAKSHAGLSNGSNGSAGGGLDGDLGGGEALLLPRS
jgi:hypothetical protein